MLQQVMINNKTFCYAKDHIIASVDHTACPKCDLPSSRPSVPGQLQESSLHLPSVSESQAGNYSCTASNTAGSDSVYYTLNVRSKDPNKINV